MVARRKKLSRLRRIIRALLVVILIVVASGWALGCFLFSSEPYAGPVTDHFDGELFHNQVPVERDRNRKGGFWKWMLTRDPGVWEEWTDATPGPPPPARAPRGEMRVTFVGHATALVQMDGLNILTDPVWSKRIGPVPWLAGPKRHRPPGIRFEELPPIDIVLVSHNHYDHLDLPTIRRLIARDDPLFFTGLGNAYLLKAAGAREVHELDWWEERPVGGEHVVTFVPAQHFSMRGLCDRNKTLWGGFVVRGPAGKAYFAGDTGLGPHFPEIRRRFGPIQLALLPIGAYLPAWFMGPVHLSPKTAIAAHLIVGARTSVPIHYGTFRLGDDGQFQGVDALRRILKTAHLGESQFTILDCGAGIDLPPAGPPPVQELPPSS